MHVLVVDDHPLVRMGVRRALEEGLPGVRIGEASTAAEALAAVDRAAWDAVVLDLSLPGRDGFDVLAEIKHRRPRLPVLVLSVHAPDSYAVRAIRSGASGYLSKVAPPDELARAVARVATGRRYVSEDFAEQIAAAFARGSEVDGHERLSGRELDVLRGIGAGKTVAQIAAQMHLSAKTVSTYRTRLVEKLELRTNAQLVRYALEHGLVL